MKTITIAARAMTLCFGAFLAATSINCIGSTDELEDEVLQEDDDAVTQKFTGFTSFNIYAGVPATSVKCELDPADFNLQVTAIRHDLFTRLGGSVCNKCAKVTSKAAGGGNGKTVIVRIIDESNDFSSNGGKRLLDMAPQAFRKIGNTDAGSIPVSFQIVNCPTRLQ